MTTYVFEDIHIGGLWRAMIAVGKPRGDERLQVVGFMAFNEAHSTFADMVSDVHGGVRHGCLTACMEWLDANRDNIPALHAAQMRKIRGRRALVNAVENFDPAIDSQARDIALRAVVRPSCEPMTVQELSAKLFPNLVGDGTNNDSPDADWRDRG